MFGDYEIKKLDVLKDIDGSDHSLRYHTFMLDRQGYKLYDKKPPMSDRIEEIIKQHTSELCAPREMVVDIRSAMLQYGKELLEKAADNAEVEIVGDFDSGGEASEYAIVNKESITQIEL